ncbi:uncharacterized protein K452DRAFT_235401 [Aplosporella prunicola CBS 121167]|uniref:AMP-dependent synthetase/ligase domain-containing protein n=1 Tax=Aplosporella prunicola CBS 121167 TaxID=1176127 RepID=A0A6A6B4Q3_9PEZI|nr:uncharacterized protein K452DRAFT_235401 [Aplosporella prunicola CBS 121167]KAF2137731.1 hypothetical protein K452DRAFT_235401 [Aplosporella prunicola CBS 121167]
MHLAEIDGGPLDNQSSIFSLIEQGLRKNPHGTAIICTHQPESHLSDLLEIIGTPQQSSKNDFGCLALTYSQIHHMAKILATGMLANGVQPKSIILMMIPNGGEHCVLLWACIIMRLTYVCVDPSALDTSKQAVLLNTLKMVKPSLIVVPNATGAEVLQTAVVESHLAEPLYISLQGDAPNGWKSLLDFAIDEPKLSLSQDELLDAARDDDPNRIHSILFTSGTSGQPKGCPLRAGGMSHVLISQSWLLNGDNCALALQQAHNSRAIAPAQMLQTWKEGGAVVASGRGFSVDDMADAIEKYHVTFIVLSPAMVHSIGQRLASRPFNVESVRSIQLGGDAVTKDLLIRCAALFPCAKICINHGMTEGGGSFKWPFFSTPTSNIPYFGEICPIGTIAPGAVVRIWDTAEGTVSKRDRPGELHLCSGSLIPHYMDKVSESSFYEDNNGRWFNTCDIAMIANDGLVYILGRKKDMIKRNGIAVMPAAIESCLEKYVDSQASVVAVPHPTLGHEPYAVLKSFNGKSEDDIRSHVLYTLGNDYELGGLSLLERIGLQEFPVNETHKVKKLEVEAAVWRFLNGN